MNAEILAVGTEVLLGDILNTNAQYLSKELAGLGINVYRQTVVGDNEERLLTAYEEAFGRSELIIATGGLGPTDDDITKEIAAKYFNKELVLDEQSLNRITDFFSRQSLQMTDSNKKQAMIPSGASAVKNEKGTAPGMILEENGKILILLPGPPQEAIPMFEKSIKPFLQSKQDSTLVSRVLRLCGIGESLAENQIKDLLQAQTNPTIAPYAKTSEVHLRITASAKTEEEAHNIIEPVANELYKRFGEHIYGEGETTLEESVVNQLVQKGLTLAVAESCTGGMLCERLVNFPGVSQVLKEGLVTYSNEAKVNRLKVKQETLDNFGAVSHNTAYEMAKGVCATSNASVGISTTGIAGPSGGTAEKPVGLVYIGICINNETKTKEFNFIGDRQRVRQRTVTNALDWLRRELYKAK